MPTFTKRLYTSWRVVAESRPDLRRTFTAKADAQAYADSLRNSALGDPADKPLKCKVEAFDSTGWQVRIRCQHAPALTKTFRLRADAENWAKEKEGEIVKRQFVDYREADRNTLGDLLDRYDRDRLGDRDKHDPDRVRIRKLREHPVSRIRLSVLQPGDLASYRDERLKVVKGSTVKKELELMARTIALARLEWKVHLAHNPASGRLVKRPGRQEGDERDRRLSDVHVVVAATPAPGEAGALKKSPRRQQPDDAFERDPETDALLSLPQSELQALLRASRYPDWFTQRKRQVTAATVKARQRRKETHVPIKARLRPGCRIWATVSIALHTAMRRGEIVKLRWQHVHLERGYLDLPGSITKNRKPRIVPLTLRARRILATQPKTSEMVFATNANTLKLAWQRARKRVSSQDLRFHDLRHEATSRLFERTTLRETDIGFITGHTDPRMLARYYNKRPHEFVGRFHASFKSSSNAQPEESSLKVNPNCQGEGA